MLPLALIPLIMQGASMGMQLNDAAKQKRKANSINPQRPEMGVPKSIKEKTNILKSMANSSLLPAQGYYENLIGSQTARSTRRIQDVGGSSNEVISGLSALDEQSRAQQNQLIAQGAEMQAQNKLNYGNALSEKAAYEQEAWDYNQNQSYQTELLKKQALIDASNRNFQNALMTSIDAASTYSTGVSMDRLYGTNYYTAPARTPKTADTTTSSLPTALSNINTTSKPNIGASGGRYDKRKSWKNTPTGFERYNNFDLEF